MKKVFLLALFLVGPVAHACPELAGNYTCVSKQDRPTKLFMKDGRAGGKQEYRFRFVGNKWLEGGESRIRVPHRWRQEDTTYTSVCVGAEFSLMEQSINAIGERQRVTYRFEKMAGENLRFRVDADIGGRKGTLMDYDCRK